MPSFFFKFVLSFGDQKALVCIALLPSMSNLKVGTFFSRKINQFVQLRKLFVSLVPLFELRQVVDGAEVFEVEQAVDHQACEDDDGYKQGAAGGEFGSAAERSQRQRNGGQWHVLTK